jgi:zinc protease
MWAVWRTTSIAAIVMTLAACATARTSRPVAPDTSVPARHVLPNGMRVITQQHRAADVVALQLWVQAGGRDESDSELGLAHYLEHMLFKGTPTRPPGFIDRDIERVGGRINAGTSHDYTYYHAVLPASRAAAGIDMLADVAVNAALDESLLEHEKQVVLEEMRLHEDRPRQLLARRLRELVFDNHVYGRPVIGRPDLIRTLTRDTLHGFYRRHYTPEAFTLVIVGSVDTSAMLAAATRAFGRLPRTPPARLPVAVTGDVTPRRDAVVRPTQQAYLGLAWAAPRVGHADAPAMELLMVALAQARSARLVETLREQRGLVHGVRGGYSALEGAGVATISAELPAANLGVVEQAILGELRRVQSGGLTDAERARAVTAAEAQYEFSVETAEGRAFMLGRAETLWRMEEALAWVDRLRSVSAEQIRSVARRYLDPERYVAFTVRPSSTQ